MPIFFVVLTFFSWKMWKKFLLLISVFFEGCPIKGVIGHIFSGICIWGTADERRQTQMPACRGLIRVHPRFVKAVFPRKNPGKLLPGYLFWHSGFYPPEILFSPHWFPHANYELWHMSRWGMNKIARMPNLLGKEMATCVQDKKSDWGETRLFLAVGEPAHLGKKPGFSPVHNFLSCTQTSFAEYFSWL